MQADEADLKIEGRWLTLNRELPLLVISEFKQLRGRLALHEPRPRFAIRSTDQLCDF